MFNFDFLIYPKINTSTDVTEANRGFTEEIFFDILNLFPLMESSVDLREILRFKYQIFNEWMCNRMYKIIAEGDVPNLKHLLKIALHELMEEVPTFLKFFVFVTSMSLKLYVRLGSFY